jgi:RNA polymerase sigma factor (sigma-70 family)
MTNVTPNLSDRREQMTENEPNDPIQTELVQAAATGDVGAYEKIVKQFNGLVWSICVSSGLDHTDSEDVVQGVWLRVVQNLGSLREPEKFAGWLARIARNECIGVVRRTIRARTLVAASPSERHHDGADVHLLEAERVSAVHAALAGLDTRCRELLHLLTSNPPVSYFDIGEAMEIPVASIGPTRARCLDKLRRAPAIVSITDR